MVSLVRGFRPVRAARALTENEPKPTRFTASPRFRAPVTASMIASRARPASALDRPALSATWSINSLLFTGMEELLVGGSCPLMKPGLPAVHRDLPGRWKSSRWVILRAAHLEFDHDPRLRSDPVPAPEPGEGTMDQC